MTTLESFLLGLCFILMVVLALAIRRVGQLRSSSRFWYRMAINTANRDKIRAKYSGRPYPTA
jgi:hypothetical protein